MSTTTTTGTLTAGSSKTFTLAPGAAVSLTLSPNPRVTITETPESIAGSGVGGNTTRVHEPQLPGTFAYGPYAMGGVVVVAVASNSGSSVTWTRKDTVVTTSADGTSLVSGDGIPKSLFARPAPNNILAKWDYGTVATAVASASDFTYHTTLTVEYAATRFRFALLNLNAATCTVGPCKIAASNAIGADPTIGSTTGQARFTPSTATWVNVTWSAATTVTLPARVSATEPSITWSDWIDISTIPRTDGGTLPVVMIRYLVPSSGSTNAYNIGGISNHKGQAIASRANTGALATTWTNGRLHQCLRYTGDGVTTPGNFQPTTDFGYTMVVGMEYASKRPGYTILGCGDSIMAGAVNSSAGNFGNGWLWQAVTSLRASLPNTPIEVANIGVSSALTPTFLTRMNSYIAAGGRFDIATYSLFSPNDGTPNQASIDAGIRLFAQAMDVLKTAKKPAVVVGPCPNTAAAWNAAADAFRLQLRTEMLAYPNTPTVDFESIGNGASPARFTAEYTTDGTHPNEAGHAVIARLAAAALLPLIG